MAYFASRAQGRRRIPAACVNWRAQSGCAVPGNMVHSRSKISATPSSSSTKPKEIAARRNLFNSCKISGVLLDEIGSQIDRSQWMPRLKYSGPHVRLGARLSTAYDSRSEIWNVRKGCKCGNLVPQKSLQLWALKRLHLFLHFRSQIVLKSCTPKRAHEDMIFRKEKKWNLSEPRMP